jgi:hypothetical protein
MRTYVNVSVDIDVDDFYDELDDSDKQMIAEWLYNDHIIPVGPNKNTNTTFLEDEFLEKMSKICSSYVKITTSQLEILYNISSEL